MANNTESSTNEKLSGKQAVNSLLDIYKKKKSTQG